MSNSIKTSKSNTSLHIATDHIPSVETVSVNFLVKSGSRHEKQADNGISHFLEHMAFKGTTSRTARNIAEEFDMIGGNFNAYTSRERTVYYAKVLKENIDVAVDILADILQNSLFEEEEIQKEKDVILQELAQTIDTPDDFIFDHFQEVAYPKQSLGRSILGTKEFITSTTKEQLTNYINNNYGSNNVFASAAGNVEHNQFSDLINQKFSNYSNIVKTHEEAANYVGGDIRINKDLEQIHFILGLEGVSYLHDDYYVQQICSVILGGGMSSRLFQKVREEKGLAYNISSFCNNFSDTGLFSIYSGTNEKNINELIDISIQEMFNLADNITDSELVRAKAQVKASLLMSQESTVSRAEKLGGNYAFLGHYLTVQELINKVNNITTDDIKRCFKNLFNNNSQPTVATIGKIDNMYSYEDIRKKLIL